MQWHQLDHMQTIYILLQTDNNTNISSLNFYKPDAVPDAKPAAMKSIKLNLIHLLLLLETAKLIKQVTVSTYTLATSYMNLLSEKFE